MSIRNSSGNPDRFFSTEHLKSDLKDRSVRGGVITIAAQAFKFALTLVSNVVLARLLTPDDYGLVGMVTAVMEFVTLFKDLGLSMATVQRENINHEQVSTLFWINVAFSVVTTVITIALSPGVAWFYNTPRLTWITIALAIGIVISGLGVQHAALLTRQMRYKALMLNDIFAQLLGVSVAIISAHLGFSYWALVILSLVKVSMSTLGVWIVCRWRPSLPFWKSEVQSMLAFGSNVTGFNIINYFARNLDNVLIGKYWGTQQLGLYSKAYQLLVLPLNQINTPITNVAIPLLSRLTDSPEHYRQTYLRILEKMIMLTMPLTIFMITTSDWLIQLLLGKQWLGVSRLFMWLGIAGVIQPISSSVGWLFISQGRTHHLFQWGIFNGSITIISFFIGLPYKAVGVAITYSLRSVLISMPLLFWFIGRQGPIRTKDFYLTVAPSALASIAALTAALIYQGWLGQVNTLEDCILILSIIGVVFVGTLCTMPRGRLAIRDVIDLVSTLKAV